MRILTVFLIASIILVSGCTSQTDNLENSNNLTNNSNISNAGSSQNGSIHQDSQSEKDNSNKAEENSGTAIFEYVDSTTGDEKLRMGGSEHRYGEEKVFAVKIENIGDAAGNFSREVSFVNDDTGDSFTRQYKSQSIEPGETGWANQSITFDLMRYWTVNLEHNGGIYSYEVKPPIVNVGEEISTSRLSVTLNNIEYWDSYDYTVDGETYTDESGEYESFVVLDYTFENSRENGSVKVPPRDRFQYDLSEPYSVNENPEFDAVQFNSTIKSGETEEGKVLFKESASKDWHIPEKIQLTYTAEAFDGIWNITREDWPEDIEITEE